MTQEHKLRGVNVDEDGYVALSVDAWRYYALLFATHGVDSTQALDTLEDFTAAVAQCKSATVYQSRSA